MARFIFPDEGPRDFWVDWAAAARGVVGTLHLYAGRHPSDPRLAELIGDLSLRDNDFRRWWADHDVYTRTNGTKRYRHPVVGDLVLGYEAFVAADDVDQTLGLHTAEAGSPSEERLKLLARWAAAPELRSPAPRP